MAKTAFMSIIGLTVVILGMVFFGTPPMAANLTAATPLLMILVGALVATVGHYNHMVYSLEKGGKDVECNK